MFYDYSSSDLWGWDGQLTPVPGFGFFPGRVKEELDALTKEIIQQDVSEITDLQMSNLSATFVNQLKCTILNETWPYMFPHLAAESQAMCFPTWYGGSCLPPTLGGSTAIIPCIESQENTSYFNTNNDTRYCLPTGDWAQSDKASPCQLRLVENDRTPEGLDFSVLIYMIGYSVSLLALFGALFIFLSSRELRFLRHKIHIGLFLTVGLADISWIFTAFVQSLIDMNDSDNNINTIYVWCISQITLRYFHLTTFFWMFLEGLYLLLQIQLPLTLAVFRHFHCLLIGWALPLMIMIAWTLLRIFLDTQEDLGTTSQAMSLVLSCPFVEERYLDFFAYKVPVLILLVVNTVFLLWIMLIVVSKLHFQTAMDFDRRHYRAAKALVVVIPMLGFTYVLTLLGPSASDTPTAYAIFQTVRAVLLSTQGVVITLPYCYFNTEVQSILTTRWNRWRMIKTMESECLPSTRKSSLAAHSLNGEKRSRLRTFSL